MFVVLIFLSVGFFFLAMSNGVFVSLFVFSALEGLFCILCVVLCLFFGFFRSLLMVFVGCYCCCLWCYVFGGCLSAVFIVDFVVNVGVELGAGGVCCW